MFMPSTSVILLAIAVLAVLLTLAWFVEHGSEPAHGTPTARKCERDR